jgi:small subunit ribosomal protein S27Ae
VSKEGKDGVWKFYSVDREAMNIKFVGRRCPRCGAFMGYHKNGRKRWHCGQCNFTEYI